MNELLLVLNAFVEDTCVLVVVAFLLTRGRVLDLVFAEGRQTLRNAALAGLLLGAVGATEYVFPNQRYPYVPQTLFVTFAAIACDPRAAAVTAVAVAMASLPSLSGHPAELAALVLSVALSIAVGLFARRLPPPSSVRGSLVAAFIAGTCAQAGAVALHLGISDLAHTHYSLPHAVIGVPANGVGVLLLVLVVQEARVRAQAERHRLEAEYARMLAAQHQFAALRARLHPHFLFNTLTSIAALCGIAPDRAEQATVRLGELMRRALEADPSRPIPLADEITDVRSYVEIARMRLGDRLCLSWDVAADLDLCAVRIPPFAVITLLENALQHGLGPRPGRGQVTISIHRRGLWTTIAVRDNGVGMSEAIRRNGRQSAPGARLHGLALLDEQLRVLYGGPARVRWFSREGAGTLVGFQVPVGSEKV